MPVKKSGVNAKAEAGRAKKAVNADKKAQEDAKKQAAAEEAAWKAGANNKKAARDEEAAAKADEAARKRREKAELLAAEEEVMDNTSKPKKAPAGAKKKGKKKDELALLENALVSAADKKVKQKKAELLAKQQSQKAPKEEEKIDPLMANTNEMIGNTDDEFVGRNRNKQIMEAEGTSGIDAALGSLNVTVGEAKSAKQLYLEFEEKMLPVVKEDHPGLRLSQYKEKIWLLWKKSPDNPANQMLAAKAR